MPTQGKSWYEMNIQFLRRLYISSPAIPTKTQTTSTFSIHSSSTKREQHIYSLFKQSSTTHHLQQIHAQILKSGFHQYPFILGKIITQCAISPLHPDSMDYAVSVFEQLHAPDGFIWNTVIRGIGNTSRPTDAFRYYKRMLGVGERADNFTYSFLLKICGKVGDVRLGKQTHCCCFKQGFHTHVHVRNTIIHMYGLFGDVKTATHLFDLIPVLDLVAWNTIIDCYVCWGKYSEALELFLKMVTTGIEPDDSTLVVILSACSNLGALDFGEWVCSRISYADNISVSTSIVDMYSKCGEIEKAWLVFDKMKKKNLVSWNSMILGLAMHGHADRALELFCEMQQRKVEVPNDVTFLGVLCACSHRGLVDRGRMYFDCMVRDYGIQPTIKHYGCMVDLLGRAGLVEEAYELIRSMRIECNAIVWRTLLAACRVHGNLVLGEQVRRHIGELKVNHSGDYLLVADMYANEGRWSDVLRVRGEMSSRHVWKPKPGKSSIDV